MKRALEGSLGVNEKMTDLECPRPSCGFLTTGSEYFGSYNICPICGWEDDGVQLANPASGGGANSTSLIECQEEILNEFPIEIQQHGLYNRDPKWRPLNENEKNVAKREREDRHWKNKAVLYYHEAYWMRD